MEQTFDFSQADPLFVEIAQFVVATGKAHISALQRNYEIGFNRANRIILQLEAAGIIGKTMEGNPRAILCTSDELEHKLIEWSK